MEIIQKPLGKRQRSELEGVISFSAVVTRLVLFVAFVLSVAAILKWLQSLVWSGAPFWLLPTLGVAVWIYCHSARWTGGAELRRRVREDLAAGVMTVVVLQPETVEEVEEMEDEGASFFVTDVDGGTYLLTGQAMTRYKSDGFPWSRIGVMESPGSKQFFGLIRMGDSIAVSATHLPFDHEQAKRLGCFQEGLVTLNDEQSAFLAEVLGQSRGAAE